MVIGFNHKFKAKILAGTKIHTVRSHDRFKEGHIMHMATGVRTKNYNCFKEAICTGTQVTRLIKNKFQYGNENRF